MISQKLIAGRLGHFLSILLAWSLATGPSAAVKAQVPVSDAPGDVQPGVDVVPFVVKQGTIVDGKILLAEEGAGKVDLTYVTPQAVAIVTGRPRHVLTAPGSELLPHEIITAAGLEHVGFDPVDVEEFVLFVEPPVAGPPGFAVELKFAKPFELSQLKDRLVGHTQPGELGGKAYLKSAHPMGPSFFMPDERTLLVANEAALERMLKVEGTEQHSPLIDRVRNMSNAYDLSAVADIASVRQLVNSALGVAVMQQGKKFPKELQPFLDAPNLVNAVELATTLTEAGPTSLVVYGENEASAEKLLAMVDNALDMWRVKLQADLSKTKVSDDPVQRAAGQYLERLMNRYLDMFRPTREGANLVMFRVEGGTDPNQQQLTNVAVIGILVALILPAVQAAREAARRNQSMNNMKQLMLALLIYSDAHKKFPAHASYSPDGKPLLSWRVQVLPFLEEQELYQQFKLDEPWDSEHNRALLAKMPAVYANPNLNLTEGTTNYLAVIGEACIFDGSSKGIGFRQIPDGTSKTIMLVEADADRAVEWTKPADFQYDAKNPTAGFGQVRPGGWLAAFADGHVQFISNDASAEVVNALFTRAGHEEVELP